MSLATLPQRGLQYAGAIAGFCVGVFVVAACALAVFMGAWMIVETIYLMGVALFGD